MPVSQRLLNTNTQMKQNNRSVNALSKMNKLVTLFIFAHFVAWIEFTGFFFFFSVVLLFSSLTFIHDACGCMPLPTS